MGSMGSIGSTRNKNRGEYHDLYVQCDILLLAKL